MGAVSTISQQESKIEEVKLPLQWLLVFSFFTGLSISCFFIAATVNFLDALSYKDLPLAFVVSGTIGIITGLIYTSVQPRVRFSTISVSFLLAFICAIFVLSYEYKVKELTYVTFAFIFPLYTVLHLIFQGIITRTFNVQQEKKLSVRLKLGLTVSSFLAFLCIYFWQQFMGDFHMRSLIMISGCLLLVAFFIYIFMVMKFNVLRQNIMNAQYIYHSHNIGELFRNRYAILLTLFALISTMLAVLLSFSFLAEVEGKYTDGGKLDEGRLVTFLSLFSAGVVAVSFFIKILFRKNIIKSYGLKTSLLILPVVLGFFVVVAYVVGYQSFYGKIHPELGIVLSPFLMIVICQFIYIVLNSSLETPLFNYYFLQIEKMLRLDLYARIGGMARQLAFIITGIALIFLLRTEPLTLQFELSYNTFLLLGVILIFVIVIYKTHADYEKELKITLEKQQGLLDTKLLANIAERMRYEVLTVLPQDLPRYLNTLNIIDPIVYRKAILGLLRSNRLQQFRDEAAQRIVIPQASKFYILEAMEILENLMKNRYFQVSQNKEVIEKAYEDLRTAKFRLKKIKYVQQLTISKLINERIFGALLTNYISGNMKVKLLKKLLNDENQEVRYQATAVISSLSNAELYNNIIQKLGLPQYSNAATAAAVAIGENMFEALDAAFYQTGQEEKVQMRIVQIYRGVGTEKAIGKLLKILEYKNPNVVSVAIDAIGRCGYVAKGEKEQLLIKRELSEVSNVFVRNISSYLDLRRETASGLLLNAMRSEIQDNYNAIFSLLALLYKPQEVELVKKNINSGDPDRSEFATELLNIFIGDEIKNTTLPILDTSTFEEKIKKLQNHIPSQPLTKNEVLHELIQRDYKWVNRWTKTCALKELSEENSIRNKTIFLANVVNPDPMIKETAMNALSRLLSQEEFEEHMKRLHLEETSLENISFREEKEGKIPKLKFEIIKFFNEVPLFNEISGLILLEIAKIAEVVENNDNETIINYSSHSDMDYFIIYSGALSVVFNNGFLNPGEKFDKASFINSWDFINRDDEEISIVAHAEAAYYKIPRYKFNELVSFYEEIPTTILRKRKIPEVEHDITDQYIGVA